jgi:hypothetical protein
MSAAVFRLAILSALAFVIYGGWAAFANREHGVEAALWAFGVQGFSSALTTALMGGLIERLRRPLGDGLGAKLFASAVATAAAGVCHVGFHLLAGTPEIARTVIPSVVVGFLYAVTYAAWTGGGSAASAARRATP